MSPQVKSSSRLMPVTTILTPGERQRVDAAAEGLYSALHRESFDEVLADLRERRAGAVLISIARYGLQSSARMAAMVREFPRVPAMALLTETHYSTPQNLLSLGVAAGTVPLITALHRGTGDQTALFAVLAACSATILASTFLVPASARRPLVTRPSRGHLLPVESADA